MAPIEYRENKHGEVTSARAIWYDNGDRMVEPFPDPEAAERWKAILDLVDDDTEKAECIVRKRLSDAPLSPRLQRSTSTG